MFETTETKGDGPRASAANGGIGGIRPSRVEADRSRKSVRGSNDRVAVGRPILVWNRRERRPDEPLERQRNRDALSTSTASDDDENGLVTTAFRGIARRDRAAHRRAPVNARNSSRCQRAGILSLLTESVAVARKRRKIRRFAFADRRCPFGADSIACVRPSGLRASRRAPVPRLRPRLRRASPEPSRPPPPRLRRRDTPSRPHRPVARPRRSHRCRRSARCRTGL